MRSWKDGTFVTRGAGEGPRADASHRAGPSGRNADQSGSNEISTSPWDFFRIWCPSSWPPLPHWSGERSYLIHRVPSPVFIDFQKLGFHGWQASCHSFFSVPGHGQPQLPADRKNCAVPRFSVAGEPITVTPRTACSWRKHAAGYTYTVLLSSGGWKRREICF